MLSSIASIYGLSLVLLVAGAPSAEELYRKGESLYKQNKLSEANGYFRKVRKALQTRKSKLKKGSMPWNLMEFGQLNALYLMSQIAWKKKLKRRSCRLYQSTVLRLNRLPKGWQQWQVQEDARKRLTAAQTNFKTTCDPVPSEVKLSFSPTNAKVEQMIKGKWVEVKATPGTNGQRTIQVLKTPKLELRVTAKEFLPLVKSLRITPWSQQSLKVTLKAKPKPRRPVVVARRDPPKPPPAPTPVYKKGWFWAVIGVGSAAAIGGVIAGVVISQQPYTEGLRNGPNDPGFSLW